MSKSLRRSEKWFRRGLWLVALVFAGFLITLGGLVIGDLPHVERSLTIEDFLQDTQVEDLRAERRAIEDALDETYGRLRQAKSEHEAAKELNESGREALKNWVSTRTATDRPDDDDALVERTRALDKLTEREDQKREAVRRLERTAEDQEAQRIEVDSEITALKMTASNALDRARDRASVRIFGYRLLVTLPLLMLAGWLFAKRRQSKWWPFVWGFIFFALFVFFVELVPYLPSFGGYVRAIVGVVITVLVGRYAIIALNRYLEQQREIEAQPDIERRKRLSYDIALARLDKHVCPSCERSVDLDDGVTDFCPHCGIGLYDQCKECMSRKNAFSKFCFACGAPEPSNAEEVDSSTKSEGSAPLMPKATP